MGRLLLFEVANCDLKVSLPLTYLRGISAGVPEANHLDRSLLMIDAINDTI